MKINLTDQELNEWVDTNIFGVKSQNLDVSITADGKEDKIKLRICSYDFCNDLNHTYLMEEKIREMEDNSWDIYRENLMDICGDDIEDLPDAIHASARQRCEAAYLTFKENE